MMENAAVGIIQIDAGRVGGITTAGESSIYAEGRGVAYVNHTFTSHLALSASLQPFAGIENADLCEYPVSPRAVSWDLTENTSPSRRRRSHPTAGCARPRHDASPPGHP